MSDNEAQDLNYMPTMRLDSKSESQRSDAPRHLSDIDIGEVPTMRPEHQHRERNAIQIGDILNDRYVVEGILGRGGMGVVYKCFDKLGKINVALKALPQELSHDENAMEDIRDNFSIVEKLNHPNIANVKQIEYDPNGGTYYLIMELIDGETLRSYVNRRRKEEGEFSIDSILPIL